VRAGLPGVFRPPFGDETVANPGLGEDVLAIAAGFKFFAQLAHENAQVFGLIGRLRSPDGGQQRAVGDDLSLVAGHVQKQVELLGSEMHRPAENRDGVGFGVDDKVAGLNGGGGAFGRAAKMGADAGEKFLDAEGLGDVVVSAGVKGFTMMGVEAEERMARQTSTPVRPGMTRSVTTRSGGQSRKTRRASSGSLAVRTS
jgi:hypothetical protein